MISVTVVVRRRRARVVAVHHIMSCVQNDSQCEMKLSIQRIFVGNTLLTLQTNGKIEINPVDRRPGINELGECRISVRDQKKALRIWNRTVV